MIEEASTIAPRVDGIFWLLAGIGGTVMLIVGLLVLIFSIRYRRGSPAKRGPLPTVLDREIEIGWTVGAAFVALFIFWWASSAQIPQFLMPDHALQIHVVAKQWMWKVGHPSGAREIDALHVPVGVPVQLVMTSQDVIHSFAVPAFRVKQDVLPGRYTSLWFEASKPGSYHLFCTEYCGTDHSRMTGTVTAMNREDYSGWIAAQPQGDDLAAQGARLFVALGCSGCHQGSARVRAPSLAGLYESQVPLQGGGFVTADEEYLRDSVMRPEAQIVAGYPPVMPSYQGIASEEEAVALIAYLKTMGAGRSQAR